MIDNDKLLKRLKEGMSNAQGGREFNLSAERVRQKRNEFIEKGLLTADIKHDGRTQRAQRKQVSLKPQPKPVVELIIEPDEALEQWAGILEKARLARTLEKENETLRNVVGATRAVLEETQEELKKTQEVHRRFKVAQQQKGAYGD